MPKEGQGWSKIVFNNDLNIIPDLEDLVTQSYATFHEEACNAKQDFYKDQKTGYSVYTEYGHKKRGKCCGSGCRHCP